MEAQRKEVNHLATQPRSLLSKKAVRQFIKGNGKHITQVEATFYTVLEQKIKNAILKAIANNASRHRLTQYELLGNGNSNEVREMFDSRRLTKQLRERRKTMAWRIKVCIPVETEEGELYATREEAERDVESLRLMQPENVYAVEETEEM